MVGFIEMFGYWFVSIVFNVAPVNGRMNGHRSDIKHNRNKPVAEHFNKPDHSLDNLKLAVIKKVKGKTKQQREVEEQKIIFKLDCVNQGLNKDYSFMSNYV